jgi:hypothetical protein
MRAKTAKPFSASSCWLTLEQRSMTRDLAGSLLVGIAFEPRLGATPRAQFILVFALPELPLSLGLSDACQLLA